MGPCQSNFSLFSSPLDVPLLSSLLPSLPNYHAASPLSHQISQEGGLFAPALVVVPQGRGARPHQGGIRAGLSSCLRLKACLDTCRTSPSQACTSCLREAESADSSASTALVTWEKQRVRNSIQTPPPHAPLSLIFSFLSPCPRHHCPACPKILGGWAGGKRFIPDL